MALGTVLLAATAVEPSWLGHLGQALLWAGGWWRLGLPLVVLGALIALVAVNDARPGVAWRSILSSRYAITPRLPVCMALMVGVLSLTYGAGAIHMGSLVRSLALFVLQLGLYPHTPALLIALVGGGAVLWLDGSGARATDVLRPRVQHAWNQAHGRLTRGLATTAVGACALAVAAAILPDAMQGWGQADPPDARRYNFGATYFIYTAGPEDQRAQVLEGFDLGFRGLTLRPGRQGTLIYRLERPAESVVLVRPNFYNRRLKEQDAAAASEAWNTAALTDEAFPNA
ncbi:MAG TPA: hypothetical protein VNM48_06930, partial [Chloroflexota bacterium]|nr:hypothetical protein [Chloroflexota bacterium]